MDGGAVPLGYEVLDRKLVVIPEEAERVRKIMCRYLKIQSVPALLRKLQTEGVLTKIQPRTSGPHRSGIPFKRGSLFYLLKNPVCRGKILHKGQIHDGEHAPIVDEALWTAVQEQLARKAPPRQRASNDPQEALLRGLVSDLEGRPMVPTYGAKGTRRYCYYETRKDLARPGDPPATRYPRGQLEKHAIEHVADLLVDEHRLRRLTGIEEAEQLRSMFSTARQLAAELQHRSRLENVIRSLVHAVRFAKDHMRVTIAFGTLSCPGAGALDIQIPLPARKPFREAKLRIDGVPMSDSKPDEQLLKLLADAAEGQRLVLASPELSVNALGKREGRCRTQLSKLLRFSWLSPRIVEMIAAGAQPRGLTRARLLNDELPMDWAEQEQLLGCAAR